MSEKPSTVTQAVVTRARRARLPARSRVDLAAMAGTSAESASRAMSRLRGNGLIDTGRRWTAVLDADGLLAAK